MAVRIIRWLGADFEVIGWRAGHAPGVQFGPIWLPGHVIVATKVPPESALWEDAQVLIREYERVIERRYETAEELRPYWDALDRFEEWLLCATEG